ATHINLVGSGGHLVLQNDDNNTSIDPQPGNPDVDDILDHEGVNHGRVPIFSNGIPGSANTISAPIRFANNGFLEGVDVQGNQSLTLAGNIDVAGATATEFANLRSFLPRGSKVLVSGNINLTDAVDNTTARSLVFNDYATADHVTPPRGVIEVTGV